MRRKIIPGLFLLSASVVAAQNVTTASSVQTPRVVIFSQRDFPAIDTPAMTQETLTAAFGSNAVLADVHQLRLPETLEGASLLVMPYGSAFPADDWSRMSAYLHAGGNLLVIGGQAMRVPVLGDGSGAFTAEQPQDSFSKQIGFLHTYAIPLGEAPVKFQWRYGAANLPALSLSVDRIFAEEGRLNGLAYLDSADGTHMAAPVIAADRIDGGRVVALPFTAKSGFWNSADGTNLLRAATLYAESGASSLTIETQYAALRPGELPEITAHLRGGAAPPAFKTVPAQAASGELSIELFKGDQRIDEATLTLAPDSSAQAPFHKPVSKGLYTIRAHWRAAGGLRVDALAENGFIVEDLNELETGPVFAASGDFLSLGGKPFFPVGTNYFSTESNGWDFSGPRNEAVWESDFADMQRHNVSFVRTGVWGGYGKYIEPLTHGANERFLRNLEAYLAAAHRHNIVVNFTFFAFSPRTAEPRRPGMQDASNEPEPNPFLDPTTRSGERDYILSVVSRFGRLPWLSYDLINEPSFSNPRMIFHGNVPNRDPAELRAWRQWLQNRYGSLPVLADAWRVTPEELRSFDAIDLPHLTDLTYDRYGNAQEVRAFDYNFFAQDMFSAWVHDMVGAIRFLGSVQLVNVGQDEGGVTNRLLNQFYALAGVSFTTNHTYWNDDALLWDSIAAKRPGMPNITGETGYQPAWNPDGSWRYDELTGSAIEERKWALGFAAGSSGAVQWDWDREVDFGMERSDGSAKVWEAMMQQLGAFARTAATHATRLELPEVAVILPQTLQLSIFNPQALEAQQTAVRTLANYNRVEAYAVGEYQTDLLGTPKLILLPSAMGLTAKAWADIEARVRAGAVLLISGPFDGDAHLHPTGRAQQLGLPYQLAPLSQRDEELSLPSGTFPLEYTGLKTTMLDRARLATGKTWAELPLGQGRVLFSPLPLEWNSRLDTVAAVYDYALRLARVDRTFTTPLHNPGVLISPTRLPDATLYVLTSETYTSAVRFTDLRSGKTFSGTLEAGRAALLLVGVNGHLLATYNWPR